MPSTNASGGSSSSSLSRAYPSPEPGMTKVNADYVWGMGIVGLGVVVARARRVSPGMFQAAAEAVGNMVDVSAPGASLLPQVDNLRAVSATVAVAVANRAAEEHLARVDLRDTVQQVQDAMWQPTYRPVHGNGQ